MQRRLREDKLRHQSTVNGIEIEARQCQKGHFDLKSNGHYYPIQYKFLVATSTCFQAFPFRYLHFGYFIHTYHTHIRTKVWFVSASKHTCQICYFLTSQCNVRTATGFVRHTIHQSIGIIIILTNEVWASQLTQACTINISLVLAWRWIGRIFIHLQAVTRKLCILQS